MSRVFLASRNAKKLAEMQRILGEHVPGVVVVGLDDVPAYDEPVEDEPDFAGNALLKARSGARVTGLPTIADDSGLCVDALNGMPGVLSARWSGAVDGDKDRVDERNNALLLAQLSDVPDERRGAHFACAVALVHPDGRELVVEGRMDGRIIREVRGSGGFGYDVVFVADEHADEGLTSAELDPAEKDRISHRGRALRELAPQVAGLLSDD
jgi:XTP/dITP diphosphohydrolase